MSLFFSLCPFLFVFFVFFVVKNALLKLILEIKLSAFKTGGFNFGVGAGA